MIQLLRTRFCRIITK